MKPVWIVDDDQSIRWVLEKALARESMATQSFATAEQALLALGQGTPSVLVTDIRMPGRDGLSLLQAVKESHPDLAVIVMTAFTDLGSTVSAFQKGAFDYLAKPFDIDFAVALIRRAAQENALAQEQSVSSGTPSGPAAEGVRGDGPLIRDPADSAFSIAGADVHGARLYPQGQSSHPVDGPAMLLQSSSVAMQEVFRAIGRLSVSRATVLVTGESGTGKELIARALHQYSARAGKPFVALNTAAIPRDLLEAELFGHERGAFTGASSLRRGRFEEAHTGTLFLDEIGDMPLELQTRLLRVIADGSFYRVGGSQAIAVDVRIVAATHQPLEQRVAQGQFREDLFHRLNVIRLHLPPLRERKEDIPALAQLFLQSSARSLNVPLRRLTTDALRALAAFDYPGNIRQLENFCLWVTVMSVSQRVDVDDLPPEIMGRTDTGRSSRDPQQTQADSQGEILPDATWRTQLAQETEERLMRNEPAVMSSLMREFERTLLGAALDYSKNRRAEAAQRLGIGRNTLTRKCQELGLGGYEKN